MTHHRSILFLTAALWGCAPAPIMAYDAATDAPLSADVEASAPVDAPPTRCVSDRECSTHALVCNVAQAMCVECNGMNDCTGGRTCVGNRCVVTVACTTSRMCPNQVCSTRLGYCVDCDADVDCTGDGVCRANVCVAGPRACRSSRECSDLGQVCAMVRGRCVDCVADTDCPMDHFCGPDLTCVARVCVPNSTTCASATRVRTCDALGSAQRDADCPAGQTCRQNRCQAPM